MDEDRSDQPPENRSPPDGPNRPEQSTLRTVWHAALAGYRAHRPYLALATGLFVAGTLLGVVLQLQGYDLIQKLGFESPQGMFPEDITAVSILLNNTRAFVLMVAGVLTLCLLTVSGLVFNGVLIGFLGTQVAGERGIAFVVAGLAPHGVLELPALFAAAAVGFRLLVSAVRRVFGDRSQVLTGREWRETGAFLVAAWGALILAAFVEFYVTGPLLGVLFG